MTPEIEQAKDAVIEAVRGVTMIQGGRLHSAITNLDRLQSPLPSADVVRVWWLEVCNKNAPMDRLMARVLRWASEQGRESMGAGCYVLSSDLEKWADELEARWEG
jgi:hypothetical protein